MAIVGPSGSGKSTVTMLVSRFYDPDRGAVFVDGHDVRGVTLQSLRRQIGVVFEEAFLFSDTVRANIAYGRPDATDEEIEAAARVAQAHEFILELPRGYDTIVGERGLTLSGGQRQRIALARAIVSEPRILILDDATSAIDSKIEEAIHEGLRGVMADRTTLLVAHRQSTLHLADRIVVLDDGRVVDHGTHDELWARSAVYRTLLSGLEEDLAHGGGGPDRGARRPGGPVGGRRHDRLGLAGRPGHDRRPGTPAGATGTLRRRHRPIPPTRHADVRRAQPRARTGRGRRSGGGGGGGWRLNLAPTPELLERVAALRPVSDFAEVDLANEARHDRSFDLRRLLGEFRRPLLLGLLLVVIDALASLAGPILIKTGIDSGVAKGSEAVLFAAAAVFLVITLIDLIDEIGETFVTGRAAERIMLSLRIRIWAHMQRLSLDYYEREMAGRIMTRMTTDVDQFESLIENGLLSALVSIVTFVGVGIALVVINVELGLCTLSVVVPLAIATVIFRRKAARLYDLSRERIAIVNADFQESISGVRVSQAFVHQAETIKRFRRLGREYLRVTGGGAAVGGALLPVRPVPLGHRRRHRARGRCRVDRLGAAHLGWPYRLHPLHRPVLLTDPAALPGLRLLAADAGVGGPDLRPHAARDAYSAGRRTDHAGAVAGASPSTTSASPTRPSPARPGLGATPRRRGPKTPSFLQVADAGSYQATGGHPRHRSAHRAGRDGGAGRADRGGEVDGDEVVGPFLRPRSGGRARR